MAKRHRDFRVLTIFHLTAWRFCLYSQPHAKRDDVYGRSGLFVSLLGSTSLVALSAILCPCGF